MANSSVLVLSNAGLRSLVATAAVAAREPRPKISLLHLFVRRASSVTRSEYLQKQASHFDAVQVIELELPGLVLGRSSEHSRESIRLPLLRPQLLMLSMTQALELEIGTIVWPVQFDADAKAIATALEQEQLARHLAELENGDLPPVDMPLLDLNNRQLIELGHQLDVPWELSWTCDYRGPRPCMTCAACTRRRKAFSIAGIVDPLAAVTAGSE